MISDIRYFYKLGYRCFEFFDENFLFDKSRALSILSELCQIGDDLQLSFPSGVMVSRIDDEICALLQKLHVKEISLALESGSEHVLHDIIQKPVDKKDFLRAVDSLKKYNIDQRVFIVSGFPGETDLDRAITVNYLKNIGITWAAINIAMPLIGSRLYDWCLEKGYIVNHNDEMVAKWGTACIQTNEYSAEYLKEAIYCMNLDVNFLNNHEMLSGEIDKVIPRFEYIVNAYEKHAFAFLCLARCYYIKGDKYLCEINLKKAMDIMNDEQVWWQRIRKFNIDINSFVTGESFQR